jgi:hypothetical protein
MTSHRKKPGVAFWATVVVVVVLVAYPLSFGPACWWQPVNYFDPAHPRADHLPRAPNIYWPIGWFYIRGGARVRRGIDWYATLGQRRHKVVKLPISAEREIIIVGWQATARGSSK